MCRIVFVTFFSEVLLNDVVYAAEYVESNHNQVSVLIFINTL